MATAIASSKLFPAAVNASVVVRAYPRPRETPSRYPPPHMMAK
ncbi:Uncharacterised protein [Mycobacteroides abscessus subsp. abscessus]|nr:Uncharacterised protein [Mycobacteroides abscessus subsp. abscessus]